MKTVIGKNHFIASETNGVIYVDHKIMLACGTLEFSAVAGIMRGSMKERESCPELKAKFDSVVKKYFTELC